MKWLLDFFVIIVFHILVRLIVYSRVHFIYGIIDTYMQYLDPVILRHNLLAGLRDLHIQPPLFNAFLGLILKLFPDYPFAFSTLYFLMGLAVSCLSYLICMHLTKRRFVSIAAACVIISFPPLLQASRWLSYAYPLTFLLLCACFFIIHIRRNTVIQIFFVAICAVIVLTRSFFHLIVWLIPVILLLIFPVARFNRAARIKIFVICSLAWILASTPYFRNYAKYGMFTSSTFQGHNIAGMVTYVGEEDITNMISQGKITPLAQIKRFSDPEVYSAYFNRNPQNDNIVLNVFYKSTGKINWNNEIYAIAAKEYQQNTLAIIKAYPLKYLKAVLNEFYIFVGDEPYRFFNKRDEWLNFRKDTAMNFASDAARLAGIPLLIFVMYAAALTGFVVRIGKDIRKYTISETIISQRCEIFILFNLVYVLLVANLFELGEGCFMRIPIDPFVIIGAAVFITDNVPSGEFQKISAQKKTFISRIIVVAAIVPFFAGLCVWSFYVVSHGPVPPGKAHKYNNEVKIHEQAVKTCKRAIRIKPDDAAAYNKLGVAYAALGQYSEALKAFKQAVRIKPDSFNAHFNLGIAYDVVGRFNKSVKSFRQVLHIRPDSTEALLALGRVYNRLGRYQDAINAFKQAIRIKPDYADAHAELSKTNLIVKVMKLIPDNYEMPEDIDGNAVDFVQSDP